MVSLGRLGAVLNSSSMIPAELFEEFRHAVNRVRISTWVAERALADRQGASYERLLAQQRVRAITTMCEQVAEYLSTQHPPDFDGLHALSEAMNKLLVALQLRAKSPHSQ